MEILILGVVLLVLGLGSTFVYDNYKENKVKQEADREAARSRREQLAQVQAAKMAATKPRPGPKPGPFTKAAQSTTTNRTVRKTIKPGSVKVGFVKPGDLPQETQYIEEFFDDVSINSKVTVQELIAKIERMKKK